MNDIVTLYYNPMSRARIAHWMLEESGAPYEVKIVDFKKNEQKDPKFLSLNPMGKLPTIVHRNVVVTEAAAICAYLADAFPQAGLAPEVHAAERGTYYRWLFFGAANIEAALLEQTNPRVMSARPMSAGFGSFEQTFNALERAIENAGPYLLGSKFSAADVYVGSAIGWGYMAKTLPPRPVFTRYLAEISKRPAYQRFERQVNEFMAASQRAH